MYCGVVFHLFTTVRPFSVARLLVAHGHLFSTATKATTLHLTSCSFNTQRSSPVFSYQLVNNLSAQSLNMCRTYSDDVTSSESDGSSGSDDDEWTDLYNRVAVASLSFVSKHGWSREAILAGVRSLGLPGVTHGMMGNGGHDLLKYFEEQCNNLLVEYLQTELQPLLFNEDPAKRYVSSSHGRALSDII